LIRKPSELIGNPWLLIYQAKDMID